MSEPEKKTTDTNQSTSDDSLTMAGTSQTTETPSSSEVTTEQPTTTTSSTVVENIESVVLETPVVETTLKNKPVASRVFGYTIALVIVLVVILAVLYRLEKEGRSSTQIFSSIIAAQEANVAVAMVNSEKITNGELQVSIQQFTQAAGSQGADTTDAEFETLARGQALDILINTKLLMQEALKKGIVISAEQITEQRNTIETNLGGAEALSEKMKELGVTEEQLIKDIKTELTIQKLFEMELPKSEDEVSEEEVIAMYDQAGGEEAGLPPLEEVREQIIAQINGTKQQTAIEGYVKGLRDAAEIETI